MGLSHTTLLFEGLALGLSAGLAPGPLTVLVVSRSARFGAREGMKASVAPLLTDTPIILAALLLVHQTTGLPLFLSAITLLGSLVLFYLGYESLAIKPLPTTGREATPANPGTLRAAATINLLNPHPWLFWFTVGGPLLAEAMKTGWGAPLLFLSGFYVMLVGAKAVLALVSARFRHVLGSETFLWINRALGAVLIVLAIQFLMSGLSVFKYLFSP